jgi:hypothetical protein
MLNGSGSVTANGQTQALVAGEYLTVPISEDLESTGAPSLPIQLSDEVVLELCLLSPEDCEEGGGLSGFITPTPTVAVAEGSITDTPVTLEPGQPTFTPTSTSSPGTITDTFTPTATDSSVIITDTFTPTPTNTATDTPTPTNTPATATCGNISLGGYVLSTNTVSLTITNNNDVPVVFYRIELNWNESTNGLLDTIIFDGNTLWGQGQTTSGAPADITLTANQPHRTIDQNSSGTLTFEFENASVAQPSSLTIYFDIPCEKTQ